MATQAREAEEAEQIYKIMEKINIEILLILNGTTTGPSNLNSKGLGCINYRTNKFKKSK